MPKTTKSTAEQAETTPLFNIGAVAHATGVPVATLRAWERRYGVPRAARSEGGHRVYSRLDIARIRWLADQMGSGVRISRAVDLLQTEETRDPAFLQSYLAPEEAGVLPAAGRAELTPGLLAEPRARFIEALLDHRLQHADAVLAENLAVHGLEPLLTHLILPGLDALGAGWSAGQVSVATEHLATHYVRQRLLAWQAASPAPTRGPAAIVLACAPNEWHDTSLLIADLALRRRGWATAYLGQAVPLTDLAWFAQRTNPIAVVLVAMLPETAAVAVEWPRHVSQTAGRPVMAYAGRGFDRSADLRDRMPGLYLEPPLDRGLSTLELRLGAAS